MKIIGIWIYPVLNMRNLRWIPNLWQRILNLGYTHESLNVRTNPNSQLKMINDIGNYYASNKNTVVGLKVIFPDKTHNCIFIAGIISTTDELFFTDDINHFQLWLCEARKKNPWCYCPTYCEKRSRFFLDSSTVPQY